LISLTPLLLKPTKKFVEVATLTGKNFLGRKNLFARFLASYENNKKVTLTGKGTGGADELASHLDDANCAYGYVKVISKDEETTRTKFVFITWKGDNAPVMRKGKLLKVCSIL
jgi:hypothetical protein